MNTIEDTIQRVRAEYVEMPGIQLKTEQLQRLFGIDRAMCQVVLDTLVDAQFLCQTGRSLRTRNRRTASSPSCKGGAENRYAHSKSLVSF